MTGRTAAWTLVDRAQAGDPDAFADLYRLYRLRVFRYLHRRIHDPETAEDLTQDVFVRALRHINRLQYTGVDPIAWLLTIAHNFVADYYKAAGHRRRGNVPADWWQPGGELDRPDDVNPAPFDSAAATLTRAALVAALHTLTPTQRRVIELRYLLDVSVEDTAALMGMTDGATKALAFRTLRKLAKLVTRESVEAAA